MALTKKQKRNLVVVGIIVGAILMFLLMKFLASETITGIKVITYSSKAECEIIRNNLLSQGYARCDPCIDVVQGLLMKGKLACAKTVK